MGVTRGGPLCDQGQALRVTITKSLQHYFKKRMKTVTNQIIDQIRLCAYACVYANLIGQYLTSAF